MGKLDILDFEINQDDIGFLHIKKKSEGETVWTEKDSLK